MSCVIIVFGRIAFKDTIDFSFIILRYIKLSFVSHLISRNHKLLIIITIIFILSGSRYSGE